MSNGGREGGGREGEWVKVSGGFSIEKEEKGGEGS